MPLLLAVTLAAAVVQPTCSWDNPGHNPYTGGAAAAIDRYTDIPEAVRSTLKRRMAEGQSDDQVNITRDGIAGKGQYDAAIRDMHFGKSSVCQSVTRSKWTENRVEPAAVYCVDQHCILVPRICGNVSRISRAAEKTAAVPPAAQARKAPREFANMGLVDAPEKEEPSDEMLLDEMQQKLAARRLLNGLSHEISEEALDEAAGLSDLGAMPGGLGGGIDHTGGAAAPVPEADTWAMLLAGLGLIGWQARRRKRRPA
jgi:hypothetical protein